MSTYSMSESGSCPKALAAARLGYEPVPDTPAGLRVMREGQRHEVLVAEDLSEMGFSVKDAGHCNPCDRDGFHVEISLPILTLVGHIDRMVTLDGKDYPVEIKSMGRFPFAKWKKEHFGAYPGYAAQEACYLEACKSSGLYVVKCRDDGELLLYTVPYELYPVPYEGEALPRVEGLPRLEVLHLGTSVEWILNKLQWVELCVQDGEMPECTVPEDQRRWCPFRYLCVEPENKELLSEVHSAELVEAAKLYREAHSLQKVAEETLEHSKDVFLQHARSTPKFQVGGVKVSYSGMQTKEYIDRKKLEGLVSADIIARATSKSRPFPGLRVTVVE